MKRRSFLQGLFAGLSALALGAKAKIEAKAPPPKTAFADIGERVVKGITGGIGRGSPRIIDNLGLRIDLDGTLYVGGEFIDPTDSEMVAKWNDTWELYSEAVSE